MKYNSMESVILWFHPVEGLRGLEKSWTIASHKSELKSLEEQIFTVGQYCKCVHANAKEGLLI